MPVGLHELPLRTSAIVDDVQPPAHAPEWAGWLADIGFLPGEPVQVLAAALPGGDPLVVRIGHSTFALRRAEAACVRVLCLGGAAPDAPEMRAPLTDSAQTRAAQKPVPAPDTAETAP